MITAQGIYDIDIEEYHTQCCDGPSVSSSGLRKILRENPARFFAFSDLNPNRFEEKEKKPLAFGRAAHSLMLGEPQFNAKFCVSPHDNFSTNPGKAWHTVWKEYVEKGEEKRQLVRPSELIIIKDMAAAQKASPEVMRAFTEGRPEESLFWKDEEACIWLKVRPDWMPLKPRERFITEYKTAVTIAPRRLNSAVFDYGYEMQAALMMDGVQIVTKEKPLGIAHIVQEKDPPYLVDCRLFTDEQIAFGRMQYRKALRIFAKCIETGIWPGYTTEPTYFETPFWVSKAMENFNDDIGTGNAEPTPSSADYLAAF